MVEETKTMVDCIVENRVSLSIYIYVYIYTSKSKPMSKGLRGEHLRLFKQYAVGLILKSTLDKVPMELQQNKHKNDESWRNIGEDLLNRSTLLLSNMYIQCPHPIK